MEWIVECVGVVGLPCWGGGMGGRKGSAGCDLVENAGSVTGLTPRLCLGGGARKTGLSAG